MKKKLMILFLMLTLVLLSSSPAWAWESSPDNLTTEWDKEDGATDEIVSSAWDDAMSWQALPGEELVEGTAGELVDDAEGGLDVVTLEAEMASEDDLVGEEDFFAGDEYVGASEDLSKKWGKEISAAVRNSLGLKEDAPITEDARLQFTVVLILRDLGLTDSSILKYFKNITELYIGGNPFSSFDLSQNTKLKKLGAANCNLSSLDLSHTPELIYLYAVDNKLTSIDFSVVPKMQQIDVCNNPLSSLDVTMLPDLDTLLINNCDVSYLDLSKNMKLTYVSVDNNRLPSIESLGLSYKPERFTFGGQRIELSLNDPRTICTINDSCFASISTAAREVQDGQTIKVIKSFTYDETIRINSSKKFTIDFQNNTLTFNGTAQNPNLQDYCPAIQVNGNSTANVTLKNLNIVSNYQPLELSTGGPNNTPGRCTVTIKGGSYKGRQMINWGTLNIKSGTFEQVGDHQGAFLWSKGPLSISGGTFQGNHGTVIQNNAKGTISGGVFKAGQSRTIWCREGGQLTIKGGTFSGGQGAVLNCEGEGSKCTVQGGTFTGGNIVNNNGATLIIKKGSFEQVKGVERHFLYNGSTMKISGGTFKAEYRGWTVQNSGKATITGGTFITKNSTALSNYGNTANLTVKGGTFTCSKNGLAFYTADQAEALIAGGTFKGGFHSQRGSKITFTGGKSTGDLYATEGSVFTINKFTVKRKSSATSAILIAEPDSEIIVNGGSFTSKKGIGYKTIGNGKVTFGVKKPKKLFNVKKLFVKE